MQDRIRKNQIFIHARESPLIKFSSRLNNMIETTMKTCDGCDELLGASDDANTFQFYWVKMEGRNE
jgi:hypothetical protein